jgi:hypothetical protein
MITIEQPLSSLFDAKALGGYRHYGRSAREDDEEVAT